MAALNSEPQWHGISQSGRRLLQWIRLGYRVWPLLCPHFLKVTTLPALLVLPPHLCRRGLVAACRLHIQRLSEICKVQVGTSANNAEEAPQLQKISGKRSEGLCDPSPFGRSNIRALQAKVQGTMDFPGQPYQSQWSGFRGVGVACRSDFCRCAF